MNAIIDCTKKALGAWVAVSACALVCAPAYAQQAPASDTSAAASTAGAAATAAASEDATELAKKLQNPIGELYNIPFQSNTNFNVGPNHGTQEILNIQPVIPFHIGPDWNIITRTIVPVIWNPSFQPEQTVPQGIGPTTFSAFLSPRNPTNGWLWGLGPVAQIPTITDPSLGSNVWGLGPTAVVVKTAGPIVAGVLVNNVFSLGGTAGRGGTRYGTFLAQPFFNYNFGGGWFVGTSPIITANEFGSGQKWTLPVGMQVGRLIKLGGKLPVNLTLGAYYNVVHPQFGANWTIRSQIAVIF